MRLLAEAAQEVDDGEDETEDNADRKGPYGSILHTAAAVGNHWIVEMQIKAGADVTVLDDHCWTALMVAKAQGHNACARLLSEHMLTIGAISLPAALWPSELVKNKASDFVRFGSDNLSATPGSWYAHLQKRVQVRSNHPIPPRSGSYYYEMTILNNGPLGYDQVHSRQFLTSPNRSLTPHYQYHRLRTLSTRNRNPRHARLGKHVLGIPWRRRQEIQQLVLSRPEVLGHLLRQRHHRLRYQYEYRKGLFHRQWE